VHLNLLRPWVPNSGFFPILLFEIPSVLCFAMSYAAAGVLIGQCAGQQGFEFGDQVEQAELRHHQHHGIRLKSLHAHQAAPHSGAPNYSSFTCTGVSNTCLLLLSWQSITKPTLTIHPDDNLVVVRQALAHAFMFRFS